MMKRTLRGREKKVRTRRERKMTAKKVKMKRAKRVKKRRARVTNKPSQCFNLDCTERGELFSRLDNYQYSSVAFVKQTLFLFNQITCETFLISPIFVDNSIQLQASLQTAKHSSRVPDKLTIDRTIIGEVYPSNTVYYTSL